ncbi:MAG: hypothetical protein ACYCQJ_13460 [Nitrososphaerales archaeon]
MVDKIPVSKYDNSASMFYKYAEKLLVPVRLLLAKPAGQNIHTMSEEFNLDENLDADFTTIFDYIREQDRHGLSMMEIWAGTNSFQGEVINPEEFIYQYIHATGKKDEAEILRFIEQSKTTKMPYRNIDGILGYYERNWLPRLEKELEKDLAMAKKYKANQEKLETIKSLLTSPLKVDKITFSFTLDVTYDPLPDLFNLMKTNPTIPMIQYNGDHTRLYKIYKGDEDHPPDYNLIKLDTGQTPRKNTLYFKLWTGEPEEEPKVTYQIGQIFFKNMHATIQLETEITEQVNEKVIVDRLFENIPSEILPRPAMNTMVENKVSGTFYIYQTKLIEDLFHWFSLNDDLFVNYLYIEEGQRTLVAKKKVQINYRGTVIQTTVEENIKENILRSPITANLSEEMIVPGSKIDVLDKGTIKRVTIKKKDPILRVDMTRASSRRISSQFMDILSKLMREYNENSKRILERIYRVIPAYKTYLQEEASIVPSVYSSEPILPPSFNDKGEYIRPKMLSKKLTEYAKRIFLVGDYSRLCQGARQPDYILESEVERWKQKKYIGNDDESHERSVLRFPPEDPKYIFVCPDDSFPVPGLIKNNMSNSNIYPELPCCYGSDDGTGRGKNKAVGLGTIITTKKILSPGGRARLAGDFKELFSLYTLTAKDEDDEDYEVEIDEKDDYLRYGVIRDPNSFIHCLLVATENAEYFDLSQNERTRYAQKFRKALFTREKPRIRYGTCKQELYDFDEEGIVKLVNNEEAFFDPLMFYRALEEYFKVNIYIFNYEGKDPTTGNRINLLQTPRHKLFHVHQNNPDRPVVMIICHMGAERDHLEYPQCELVVFNHGKEYIKKFNQDLNELLLPAMQYISRTLTWQPVAKIIQVRESYFASIQLRSGLGQIPITNQFIDEAGKARYFAITPRWGDVKHTKLDSLRVIIGTPPTAPLNVMNMTKEQISKHLPPAQVLLDLFGDPTIATLDQRGKYINGLWFPVGDNVNGIYCPCQRINLASFKAEHPNYAKLKTESAVSNLNIPVHPEDTYNPLQRLSNLRKSAMIIYQLYQYLYLLAGRPVVRDFVSSITKILKTDLDSASIYDPKYLPRVFPDQPTVSQVLNELEKLKPPFIKKGFIYLYNQNMVLGLLSHLNKFAEDIEELPLTAADYREVKNYYSSLQDFRHNPQETLLLSQAEYSQWMTENVKASDFQSREVQHLKDHIQTKLTPLYRIYTEPFIFQQVSDNLVGSNLQVNKDRYYLIQNVASGDITRALHVALIWKREKRNLGFKASPLPTENDREAVPVHKIYHITSFGTIELEQDNSKGEQDYLLLLHYGGKDYGAMMVLL